MNKTGKALLWIGGIGISYLSIMLIRQAMVKSEAVDRAVSLSGDKGIINLGSGCDRPAATGAPGICSLPEVVMNVDISQGGCSNCMSLDLESATMPFSDKQFDVCLASHVLEHITNWESALQEWIRISDYQVVVLPSPMFLGGHTSVHHINFFSYSDMEAIESIYPSVEVFS